MEKLYPDQHVYYVQDDNEKQIYDYEKFLDKKNACIMAYNHGLGEKSPAGFYMTLLSPYREYFRQLLYLQAEMTSQIISDGGLIPLLKSKHLPVYLPDGDYFLKKWKYNQEHYTGENFDKAMLADGKELIQSLTAATNWNFQNALKYSNKLDLTKYAERTKEIDIPRYNLLVKTINENRQKTR